jgi:hypothetical protein
MKEWKMKVYVPRVIIQTILALGLSMVAVSALAGKCDNPRWSGSDECAPPVTDPVTLKVTVSFGEDSDAGDPANCSDYPCVETTFTATGSVICGSQVCDFSGTVAGGPPFNFPPALANLLAATSIGGTDILPHQCFDMLDSGPPYALPGSTKTTADDSDLVYQDESGDFLGPGIYEFTLRSPVNSPPDGMWWAKVRAISTDMEGVPQKYGFHFGGLCDRDNGICPTLNDDFAGAFENGYTTAVFGSNTNKRNVPYQTCRCTVSSKPGCPDNVDIEPRPMAIITIE